MMPLKEGPGNEDNQSFAIPPMLGRDLSASVGFAELGSGLGRDIRKGLAASVKGGVVFEHRSTPLQIFRHSLATAIGEINRDGRAELFLRFLKEGPYEGVGETPPELKGKRLTIEETASVISFISGQMINSFQGALMELLAVSPCLRLLRKLQRSGRLSRKVRIYVGDAVEARQLRKDAYAKGADIHFWEESLSSRAPSSVEVCGVAEVKSYFPRATTLDRQLGEHVERARQGLRIQKREYRPAQVAVGMRARPISVSVLPDDWRLPRELEYVEKRGNRVLQLKPYDPKMRDDKQD